MLKINKNISIIIIFISTLIKNNLLFNNHYYKYKDYLTGNKKDIKYTNLDDITNEVGVSSIINEIETLSILGESNIDKIKKIINENNYIITEKTIKNAIHSKNKNLINYLINTIINNYSKIAIKFIKQGRNNGNLIIEALRNNLDEDFIIEIFEKLLNFITKIKNIKDQNFKSNISISILNRNNSRYNIFIEIAIKKYKKLFDKLIDINIFNKSIIQIFNKSKNIEDDEKEISIDYYKYIINNKNYEYFSSKIEEKYNNINKNKNSNKLKNNLKIKNKKIYEKILVNSIQLKDYNNITNFLNSLNSNYNQINYIKDNSLKDSTILLQAIINQIEEKYIIGILENILRFNNQNINIINITNRSYKYNIFIEIIRNNYKELFNKLINNNLFENSIIEIYSNDEYHKKKTDQYYNNILNNPNNKYFKDLIEHRYIIISMINSIKNK